MAGGTRSGGDALRRERVAAFHVVSIIIYMYIITILWHGRNPFRREPASAGTRYGGNASRRERVPVSPIYIHYNNILHTYYYI